jgi:iron(III) transport system ATP-binding protein
MSGGNASPAVEFRAVTKRFGSVTALQTISFSIERGTLVTLLGPSGCGKTTILRLIAGLEQASAGLILIEGVDVMLLSAAERDVSMVFQSYALFPHMTVLENVCYGLRASGVRKAQAVELAQAKLALVGLAGYKRAPAERIVRRSTAACRGGARHCAGAEGAAVRRATVQSGREAAPSRARGNP